MDDTHRTTTDSTANAGLIVALLLFASVILGSGALGDDRGANTAGDNDDRDDEPSDRIGEDRGEAALDENMVRLEVACDDGDAEACEELRDIFENRMMDDRDEMRGMEDRRGHDNRAMREEGQMRVPPEVIREMAHMWCHSHVFDTFWENTNAVELDDGSGFEMITYDDDDNEESTVISHDAMSQITSGLEPLVGSCAAMMMELMGVGMPPQDHEGDWGESDEWDGDDESNIPDEDDEEQRED